MGESAKELQLVDRQKMMMGLSPFRPQEKPMPDKTDGGTWAVVRYLPFLDTSEGEFPAHLDCWYAHQHTAVTVAKDWASQHPEAITG